MAAVALLGAAACAKPWMKEESERIDQAMQGAPLEVLPVEGVILGEDAPKLAPPFKPANRTSPGVQRKTSRTARRRTGAADPFSLEGA